MNSQLCKIFLCLSVLLSTLHSATLTGAYNAYLAGSYEESYNAYSDIYSSTGDKNALYGMINALTYLTRYDEALALCKTETDPVLMAKELWILGIQNEKRTAKSRVELLKQPLSYPDRAMLYQSGGFGFSQGGNYREALRWYEYSQKIVDDPNVKEALLYNLKKKKEKVIWSGTLLGGPIIYSQSQINDRGDSYSYDRGSFFDIGSRWDIKKKHTIEAVYSRFDASFQTNHYGINLESTLFYSLDHDAGWHWNTSYSVNDSLNSWQAGGENNKYSVVDTFQQSYVIDTLGNEQIFVDTTYYLYEEQFLGTDPGNGDYDAVVSVTPDDIYQNNLYLGYSQWYVGERNLHLGGAVNLFNSNMSGMNSGALIYAYHGHEIRKISLSGHWYGTFTEDISVLQVSPEFTARMGKFKLDLIPTYLYKINAPEDFLLPSVQLSFRGAVSFSHKAVAITGSGIFGERAFVGESGGKHLVNVTLPHKFTGSLSFALTPGKKIVSYFINSRYENYEQMSRLIAFGGITLSL